jgi:hypothetical protein
MGSSTETQSEVIMSNSLTNPLQGLIARAAQTLPATTGAVEPYAERLRRINSGRTLILADVSGSMESPAWGGRSKHTVLRDAIAATMRPEHELIAFNDAGVLLSSAADLPPPRGNTALHLALHAAIARDPGRILVVSDGEPDDEKAALAAAAKFPGVIDVLYIGPDANTAAMRFLRALAKTGHGQYHGSDIARAGQPALAHTMHQLLLGK